MPNVKTLERQRACYAKDDRDLYDRLYRGGRAIREKKGLILPRNPAESEEWHKLRLEHFHYLPLAAQTIDEFAATVFQGDLDLLPTPPAGSSKRPELPPFYSEFFRAPKGNSRKTLVDLFYRSFIRSQIHRDHWLLVQFDDAPGARSRAEQEAVGALRARITELDADAVYDFEEDDDGLAWVKLRQRISNRDPLLEDDARRDRIRWTLIDREKIQAWEVEVEAGKEPDPKVEATPVEQPPRHRWAAAKRVPIVRVAVSDDLWLMDKLGSVLLEETRKRNALAWYERLCCYPQPWHKGDETLQERREANPSANQARGAANWLEIEREGELGYMEPTGQSLEHLAKRLEAMRQEIAQVTHNMASALGPEAAAQVQSAASKVRDSVAKQLLAAAYADDVRKAATELMRLVSIGREEAFEWEALGLDQHDISDVAGTVDEALKVQGLAIPSETFHRRYAKRTARRILSGDPPDVLEQIDVEIDAAEMPTAEELARQRLGMPKPGDQGYEGDEGDDGAKPPKGDAKKKPADE